MSSQAKRDVPTTEEIFGFIEDLVGLGHRKTGTAPGKAAAEYVAARFTEFGLADVHIDSVVSWRWEAESWGLAVDGAGVPCHPVTHSFVDGEGPARFTTGEGGRTAPLVDLGSTPAWDADPETLLGAIVVFDLEFMALDPAALAGAAPELVSALTRDGAARDPYHTNLFPTVTTLVQAGAVGFVGVLADYFDSDRYVNEDYGPMPIPGVWVTRRAGEALRGRLGSGDGHWATLVLEGARVAALGYTPIGLLPGRSTETIMVHSHHDSVWDGAVEDASGAAAVIALAQHFAALPAEARERTLMFVTFDTHFTGYEAHEQFVEDYVRRRPEGREILADVVVEHIGHAADIIDGELVVRDEPARRLIFQNTGARVREAIAAALERNGLDDVLVLPTSVLPTEELPTDADFTFRAGVPVISLIAGPMYLYDEADTLDKVDQRQLRPVTRAFAEIVDALDAVPRAEIPEA